MIHYALATVATAHQVDRLLAELYIYIYTQTFALRDGWWLLSRGSSAVGTVAMAGISGISLNGTVYLP
jgi:hypothetical protein